MSLMSFGAQIEREPSGDIFNRRKSKYDYDRIFFLVRTLKPGEVVRLTVPMNLKHMASLIASAAKTRGIRCKVSQSLPNIWIKKIL